MICASVFMTMYAMCVHSPMRPMPYNPAQRELPTNDYVVLFWTGLSSINRKISNDEGRSDERRAAVNFGVITRALSSISGGSMIVYGGICLMMIL